MKLPSPLQRVWLAYWATMLVCGTAFGSAVTLSMTHPWALLFAFLDLGVAVLLVWSVCEMRKALEWAASLELKSATTPTSRTSTTDPDADEFA